MTQSSFFSWTTDGTGDGTATGYTQAQLKTMLHMLLASGSASQGPRGGYLNGLTPSNPSTSTIRIATGGALVYGIPYTNDAQIDFTPGDGTYPALPTTARIHRVVLQASWAAQTVRLAFISGTDAGSPSTPSLTQTAGTTWEIPLCQFQINSAGTVSSFTDQRTAINLPLIHHRQGGNATDWSVGGTTTYIVNGLRIACGVALASGTATTVTFPVAFAQAPVVIAVPSVIDGATPSLAKFWVGIASTTQVIINCDDVTFLDGYNWIAIGAA